MTKEQYLKRPRTRFDDAALVRIRENLKLLEEAVEECMEKKNTLLGACCDRGLNYSSIRRVLGFCNHLNDESEGVIAPNAVKGLATPIEELYCDVFRYRHDDPAVHDVMPADAEAAVNAALAALPGREAEAVRGYYLERKTYAQICDDSNLSTCEGIRQRVHCGVRHLRAEPRVTFLRLGADAEEKIYSRIRELRDRELDRIAKERMEKNRIGDECIACCGTDRDRDWEHQTDVLWLSTRTYNSLTENGYNSVADILKITHKELYGIPRLGKRSREELIRKVRLRYPDFPAT